MNPFWYWEYTIEYFDDIDNISQTRSGIVTGEDIHEVIQSLCDFYGESQIENILTLKIIAEGNVLEFNEVNKNEDIDLLINKV